MVESRYLGRADRDLINGFMGPFLARFIADSATFHPGPLWHYTSGSNLIKILESGKLWMTKASCLNDTSELLYAVDQLSMGVARRMATEADPSMREMLSLLIELLLNPVHDKSPIFVACFTERKDNIDQWRGYGLGEGGYALEFDSVDLIKEGILPSRRTLLRVIYDEGRHAELIDEITDQTCVFLESLPGRSQAPTLSHWASDFFQVWLDELSAVQPVLKHPAFAAEQEWRLIYWLTDEDKQQLTFVQKQSMLVQHLPFALPRLKSVTVGPCRYPEQSKVAASDLLEKFGYDLDTVPVHLTEVPFRANY